MASVTGLENVSAAETDIALVDGERGHLIYRGHWAKDLAVSRSFEEAAHLLWRGSLPEKGQLSELKDRLRVSRSLPGSLRKLLDALPRQLPMMSVLQAAAAAVTESDGAPASWPPTAAQAERMTAILPAIIAYVYRTRQGQQPIHPALIIQQTICTC